MTQTLTPPLLTDEAWELLRDNLSPWDYQCMREGRYPYSWPVNARAYFSMGRLRSDVTSSGSLFFSPDTMRWFHSRVMRQAPIGARFFVTSEEPWGEDGRRYFVRWVEDSEQETGILGISRFDTQFATSDQAKSFARRAHKVLPFTDYREEV